jgi:glyoxylase-like metal-dependent hydrolase (beta-lactamase superfamily II)
MLWEGPHLEMPWFTVRAIGPGVWVLQEPIGRVAPSFDVTWVNIYLIAGRERAAVIDSGMGMADLLPVCRQLTDLPLINVCTHTHWDHVGGSHQFDERLVHSLEAPRLSKSYPVGEITHIKAAPATSELTDGDLVDLGGRTLAVWHTPGHSPGHISLLDSDTGYLFCADTCYGGTMWIQTADADVPGWRRSLERIAGASISAICGGHEEARQDPALARRVLAGLEQALSGRSEAEPFPGQDGVLKHRFGEFSILLRSAAQ